MLMLVKDIMTKDVISVSRKTKISDVASILFNNRLHAVPVAEDGKIVGIVTESDFFTKNSGNIFLPSYITFLEQSKIGKNAPEEMQEEVAKLLNASAEDIMSPKCVTVFQEMKIADLLEFFKTTKFATLPVADAENNLIGIVAVADVLGLVKF